MFMNPEIIPVLWFLPVVVFILIPLTTLCIWSVYQILKSIFENSLQAIQSTKGAQEESSSPRLQPEPVAWEASIAHKKTSNVRCMALSVHHLKLIHMAITLSGSIHHKIDPWIEVHCGEANRKIFMQNQLGQRSIWLWSKIPKFEMMGFMKACTTSLSAYEILQTAKLLFLNKGFDQTSVEDITGQLNADSSIFYRHFDSLDQVLEILWSGS